MLCWTKAITTETELRRNGEKEGWCQQVEACRSAAVRNLTLNRTAWLTQWRVIQRMRERAEPRPPCRAPALWPRGGASFPLPAPRPCELAAGRSPQCSSPATSSEARSRSVLGAAAEGNMCGQEPCFASDWRYQLSPLRPTSQLTLRCPDHHEGLLTSSIAPKACWGHWAELLA